MLIAGVVIGLVLANRSNKVDQIEAVQAQFCVAIPNAAAAGATGGAKALLDLAIAQAVKEGQSKAQIDKTRQFEAPLIKLAALQARLDAALYLPPRCAPLVTR